MDSSLLAVLSARYRNIPYMGFRQANYLRTLISENGYEDLLELGFFHGKSSLLLAAILEEQGKGHLTTLDLNSAKTREPNIDTLLLEEGLSHRVTAVYCFRSYTWELMQQIRMNPSARYDFCYLDGGHTLDNTGLGFFLVDRLLRVGGTIVFDDLDWSLNTSPAYLEGIAAGNDIYANYCPVEKSTPAVRLVFEHLVQSANYQCDINTELGWGIARKIR